MSTEYLQFFVWFAGSSSLAVVLAWLVTNLFRSMSAAWKNLLWRLAVITPLVVAPILLSDLRLNIPVKRAVEKQEILAPANTPVPLATKPGEGISSPAPALPRVSSSTVVTAVWLSGALAVAGLFAFQHLRLRREFRFSRKAELDPDESQAMSLTMVDVVTHSAARVPFCYGMLRPLIVLPADFPKLSRSERWICLVHELTHLRRGDLAWLALAQLSCAISWFNPLTWFALGRLKDTAELATDDAILSEKTSPTSYAQTLVAVSELAGCGKTPVGTLAMAREGSLKARLTAILDPATRRGTPGRPMAMMLLLAYLVVVGLASSVRTVEAAQQPLPPANPDRDVTVDQLANFLNVSMWKSRVTLPMGNFSAKILRIENGKIRESVVVYTPPYRPRKVRDPATQISIMSAPVGDSTKIQMAFEWKAEAESGSIATSQIMPPGKPGKYGTFTRSLPETIGVGDYPLGGEAPGDKVYQLERVESYIQGLVLRIQKSNGGVDVFLNKDGSLNLNGKAISLEELKELLGRLLASDPSQEVAILQEKGVDEALGEKVREACKSVGISRVVLTWASPELPEASLPAGR